MRIFILCFLMIAGSLALADDGTYVFQAGNTAYMIPWRMCLIVSGALSLGLYLVRGGGKK